MTCINFGKCPIYRGDSAEISAKVSVFSKRARHRGDVRNSKGFVSDFGGKFGAGPFIEYYFYRTKSPYNPVS
ncbi:hypothetical protein Prudu_338S000200 [Prunus dulcis]|uniref:Uncharacterized protein n=1 Tax=Prunus dulcis TaxID=3755 RepID=A0A5H2XME6_PRUDU|nr:hypothetical protein Prudu_338S000200 [Prunus dulcis]